MRSLDSVETHSSVLIGEERLRTGLDSVEASAP